MGQLSVSDLVMKARLKLLTQHPFWGTLTMSMEIEEVEKDKNGKTWLPTAATDGGKIYYNKEFFEAFPAEKRLEYIEFVLAHEVGHCAFRHMGREGGREHQRWNAAIDFAINQILVDQQPPLEVIPKPIMQQIFKSPDAGLCLDEQYRGKMAEEIYKDLAKKIKYIPFDMHLRGKGEEGEEGDEDGEGTPKYCGDEKEWQQRVEKAAQVAKQQGKLPNGMERFIKMLRPKVSWKTMLQTFVDSNSKSDYCLTRPNKRGIAHGMYIPSLHTPELGEIAFAADSSGSVDEKQFSQFISELNAIREAYECTVHAFVCDAKVHEYKVIQPGEELKLKLRGGGGTDFRPVFDKIKKDCPNIKCLVFLTDGYGSYPAKPPQYPVLWVLTKDCEKPPWGIKVFMDGI